ncbi:MAG: T9SS type A sorting domain-containing protein, partial [Saprospiraceae bacterium]|nr:T9SS type A sorting domain-containing protein [Saprospiraceae bacterium]
EIIASAGDSYKQPSLQLEWTLGEIAIDNLTSPNQQLQQGFHRAAFGVAIATSSRSSNAPYEINIFPNPSSTEIFIHVENQPTVKYLISNALKSNLIEGTLRHGSSISVSDLHPGFYWISLFIKNQSFTRPLVVL